MSLIVSKTNLSLNNITKTILLFLTMTIISCESSGIYEPELENNKQELGTIKLEYEFENVLPIYNQTIMVTTFNDKFIFYGWHGTIMIVNAYMKGQSSWSVIPASNDTMTWRWDGTIAKVNNQCYIFALPHMSLSNPLYPKYYNIVKLNPINYEVTALPELLPFSVQEAYPVSTVFEDKIIILFKGLDSLYVFDTVSETGKFVSKNYIKDPRSTHYQNYIAGKHQNYFYVFSNYHKQLFKIDLTNFQWKEIIIPEIVKQRIVGSHGGMLNGLLLFYGQKEMEVLSYDVSTNKWSIADPPFGYNILGEVNFWEFDNKLYFVDTISRLIWSVSVQQKIKDN